MRASGTHPGWPFACCWQGLHVPSPAETTIFVGSIMIRRLKIGCSSQWLYVRRFVIVVNGIAGGRIFQSTHPIPQLLDAFPDSVQEINSWHD